MEPSILAEMAVSRICGLLEDGLCTGIPVTKSGFDPGWKLVGIYILSALFPLALHQQHLNMLQYQLVMHAYTF